MKAILFVPEEYSLAEMLQDGFEANGWDTLTIDYKKMLPPQMIRFYEKTIELPKRITKYWNPAYFKLINKKYLEYCKQEKPDLILIYNNQFFFPETIEKLKKDSKIVFILGDNPLWSKTFDYNIAILKYADLVLSPDSHWEYELSSIGIPNIVCDYIGYSPKRFFKTNDISEEIMFKYKSDLLFIGRNYGDSSGYKRIQFLSGFVGLDFKLYGSYGWEKWLPYFPQLQSHFTAMSKRISQEELNLAINCTKIYPIDQNTGIVNGIHLRVFETIGAGSLPIVEWRKDIDMVFGETLPVIRNYNEAMDITSYYLQNERRRLETINNLKSCIDNKYTPLLYISRLLDRISK